MVITLKEIIQLVDQLSPEEKDELRDYLGHSTPVFDVEKLSPEERIRRMDEAVKTIREGLSQTELDEIVNLMTYGLSPQTLKLEAGTMDIDALLPVFRAMRIEMGEENFEAMLEDMNTDYIEPFDETEFDL